MDKIYIVPRELLYLGEGCFYGSGLDSVIIPDMVEELPTFCFSHCKRLTSAKLGDGLKIIGYYAFMNCPISSIVLPETVEELRGNCFSATRITRVVIPKGVRTVDSVAFANTENPQAANHINCAFLGENTIIPVSQQFKGLRGARIIYCLPGSKIEKYAKENFILSKPLDEFGLEEK